MTIKDFIKNSAFGLISILVLWQVYFVLTALLNILVYGHRFISINHHYLIIIILFGFILGVYSRENRIWFYSVFKPNNQNLMLALVTSLLLISFLYLFSANLASFPIKVLVHAIMFYPFSALVMYTIKENRFLLIAIIPIILLSPPMLNHISPKFHQKTCGAYVYGFMDNAPAQQAGMRIGETIIAIEGKRIKRLQDIKDITYRLTRPTELKVVTNRASYQITTVFDPVKNKQRIGTNVLHQICNKHKWLN